MATPKKIVILASGSGSNAEKIVEHFKGSEVAEVILIISNRQKAGVLDRADRLGVPSEVFSKTEFMETEQVLDRIKAEDPDLIVLAGFLLLVPTNIIQAYPEQIVNIHPALLPAYGGKGMYGHHVHEAVVANKESESGISIHYVNEVFDDGEIIFQAKCKIDPTDSPDDVQQKVHELEHQYFPQVIEGLLTK